MGTGNLELDETALRMMKMKINKLERDNAKTKEKNDKDMISEIKKIIEEESKCI